MKKSLVSLEFLSIVVRLHDEPTAWGDFAPYDDGFVLHQVATNIYEAKLAKDIDFKPAHQRELKRQMIRLGAEQVFLWRHKAGEAPYKIVITRDGIHRESAQKLIDSEALQSI
jgi:hypothetical protein